MGTKQRPPLDLDAVPDLRYQRKRRGLTLDELAQRTSADTSLWSRIECGRRNLTERLCEELASIYGLSPAVVRSWAPPIPSVSSSGEVGHG